LPITIHRLRKRRYDELVGKIQPGDNNGVKDLFAANEEELSEVFVDGDIDGIISGDYHWSAITVKTCPTRIGLLLGRVQKMWMFTP
jgi:hypothetical protein